MTRRNTPRVPSSVSARPAGDRRRPARGRHRAHRRRDILFRPGGARLEVGVTRSACGSQIRPPTRSRHRHDRFRSHGCLQSRGCPFGRRISPVLPTISTSIQSRRPPAGNRQAAGPARTLRRRGGIAPIHPLRHWYAAAARRPYAPGIWLLSRAELEDQPPVDETRARQAAAIKTTSAA